MRKDPLTGIYKKHNGVDLRARNAMVYSMFPGIVHKVGYDERSGNYVIIQHGEIAVSYCHLSKILIIKGSRVHAQEVIGISGNTGRSTGEHLHVTCKMKGTYINPEIIFQYIRNILDSSENDK
jgi:murein DD-endopeptidase MepM/ murein hydrolase activator NlpD